jgi:UDP-N-acetylglucosamine--dolichyl-phosphate N-acetylglucosaminephosphotransferase
MIVYLYLYIPLLVCFYVIKEVKPDLVQYFSIFWTFALTGYFVSDMFIPRFKKHALKKDLFGKDINKKGTPEGLLKVPEVLGIIPALVVTVIHCVALLLVST